MQIYKTKQISPCLKCEHGSTYRGFPTRMVYLYYILCLRYTILVGNPWYMHMLPYARAHMHSKHMCWHPLPLLPHQLTPKSKLVLPWGWFPLWQETISAGPCSGSHHCARSACSAWCQWRSEQWTLLLPSLQGTWHSRGNSGPQTAYKNTMLIWHR